MINRIKKAPTELQSALMQSFTAKRYSTYKNGIFFDSTGHHIFRCEDILNNLPDGKYDKEKVRIYILIHDLPEIATTDFTSIQKEDADLLTKLELLEKKCHNKYYHRNIKQCLKSLI